MSNEPRSHEALAHDASQDSEIETKFWKALKSDRTIMLGLAGVDEARSQPMTAQLGDNEFGGPIWFFTSKETDLAKAMGGSHRAVAQFASKKHELFASLDGKLFADNDRAMIEKLWSPFVAAWFEGGKDDPLLQLLRFEPSRGQIWLDEHSLFAGVKMLFGADPKREYADKTADVRMGPGG